MRSSTRRSRTAAASALRLAVIGAGGVGGYFGGQLAHAGAEVALLARGAHLTAIKRRGLRVRGVADDFTVHVAATGNPADIGPCDYVLFCVKSYDTRQAAALLEPMLKPGTAVISLQNGIDNEEKLAARIGPGHVLGGAAFIVSHISEPGVIEQTSGPCRIVFGELDGTRSTRAERLLNVCAASGIDAAIADDIQAVLWDKYAFLCALAGMTAATRLPIGTLLRVPETRELFQQIAGEVVSVARGEGIAVPGNTAEQATALARTFGPGSFSSLHHDLTTGHRLELDALLGELTRRAARHQLPVPASSVIYALLRPWEIALQPGAEPQ